MLSIQILLIFMIIAAVIAVESTDMLSSVIALGTVGLGLSLAFLLLKAPDLAAVLLIIEVLTLTTLVKTLKRQDEDLRQGSDIFTGVSVIVFIVLFLTVGYQAVKALPAFGAPILGTSGYYLREGLSRTGASNIVAAVALDFRSLDTLASMAILLLTALGVASILSREGGKKQ